MRRISTPIILRPRGKLYKLTQKKEREREIPGASLHGGNKGKTKSVEIAQTQSGDKHTLISMKAARVY